MRIKPSLNPDKIILDVYATGEDSKEIELPKENLQYWYPLNVNYFYKYSTSREMLYLVKDKEYTGEDYYNVKSLRRTKPMPYKSGVPFNPYIYKRNRYILQRARDMGLPTFKDDYDKEDLVDAFLNLRDIMLVTREGIADRAMDVIPGFNGDFDNLDEEATKEIYSVATEEENTLIKEIGEIYSMLYLMKRLIEE